MTREGAYSIAEPTDGWKQTFTAEEKAKLRPMAETLAMLDGNAFFSMQAGHGEWYEQYLPEAHALYESNGGDGGWAGEASFAKRILMRRQLEQKVEESCGCVLCDIDVPAEMHDGKMKHNVRLSRSATRKTAPMPKWVDCTKPSSTTAD